MSDSVNDDLIEEEGEQAGPVAPSEAGVVRVGNRDYAAGLLWNRSDDPKKVASKAKTDARDNGLALYALRRNNSQYGLGSEQAGHRKGMQVLADALSQTVEGNFLGIFDTGEDRYYLTAVQNGRILPGFDRLIYGRDVAYEQFSEFFFQGTDWEYAFAPGGPNGFDIERTIDRDLEQILKVKPKAGQRLQSVSIKGTLLKVAGLLAILGLGFVGWNQFEAWQERQAQEETDRVNAANQASQLAIKNKKDAEDAARQIELPIMPWFDKPHIVGLMDACEASLNTAPLSVPGWKPTTLTCWGSGSATPDPDHKYGTATMLLTRDGGTINWILPYAQAAISSATVRVIGQAGLINGAEVTWPIQGMDALTKFKPENKDANGKVTETKTSTVEAMRRYMVASSEELFLPVRLAEVPGLSVEIAGPDNKPIQVPVSKGLSFTYQVRHDPRDMSPLLEKLPVAVLSKMSLDLSNWTWTVEGVAYERVPLPADAKPYIKSQQRR